MDTNKYKVIKARIKLGISNLEKLEKELSKMGLFPKIKAKEYKGIPMDDIAMTRIVGGILHDYYCGIERILEVVARQVDGFLAEGPNWHIELIKQMTLEIEWVRPILLSEELAAQLDELRGFRHVFRGAYGFEIEHRKLSSVLKLIPVISRMFKRDMKQFIDNMDKMYLE